MSETRKRYIARLIGRCMILILCTVLCFTHPEQFQILDGMNFFNRISLLHILWMLWVIDTIQQIIPIKNKVPLGSQKLFSNRFRPIRDKINYESLRNYIISTTKAAYKVFILWCAFIGAIGVLYFSGIINKPVQG